VTSFQSALTVPCFIFFKKGLQQREAFTFRKKIEADQKPAFRYFQGPEELQTMMVSSLGTEMNRALRYKSGFAIQPPAVGGGVGA
jgi:hypothetical protein